MEFKQKMPGHRIALGRAGQTQRKGHAMTPEEFDEAAEYWTERDATSARMPEDDLRKAIDAFLGEHQICAMATASAAPKSHSALTPSALARNESVAFLGSVLPLRY